MSLITPLRNLTAGLRCLSFSGNNWMATANKQPPASPTKPATSAYNLFIKDSFPTIKRNNPNMKSPQIFKLASQEWNILPAVKKGSYEQKLQQQVVDYKNAMDKLTDEQKDNLESQKKLAQQARKVRKLKKELADLTSDKPKRKYGNNFFIQEKSKNMPSSLKVTEKFAQCAAMWTKLSATEKMPYERMSRESIKDVEAWKLKTVADGRAAKISEIKKNIAKFSV